MTRAELILGSPVLTVLAAAALALTVGVAFRRNWTRDAVEWIAYLGVIGAIVLVHYGGSVESVTGFQGTITADRLSRFISLAVLIATALTVLVAIDPLAAKGVPIPEFVALLLTSAAGMLILVMAADLITAFLGIEILSIALYVLCGITRTDPRSNESAMKYFVLGAFATGFLLYGMALLYASTGTVYFASMRLPPEPITIAGICLLVAGFAFKIGAFPFHMWVPDVYEGAPTAVTGFMSVAVKAAAFGAMARIFMTALGTAAVDWSHLMAGLAVMTLVVGNLGALTQKSVKRMLAYSSIAHTGYALLGLAVAVPAGGDRMISPGPAASIFYVFVYTLMTIGAFIFLIYAGRPATGGQPGKEAETLDDLAGLAKRRPWAAAFMTVFMVSLSGLPPTAGFFGKFLLFKSCVDAGRPELALVGVVMSIVSVVYYLKVVVAMHMQEPAESPEAAARATESPERPDFNVGMAAFIAAALTLALGLYPTYYLRFSQQAIEALLSR